MKTTAFLVVLFLLSATSLLTAGEPEPQQKAVPAEPSPAVSGPTLVVGVLTQQFREVCKGQMNSEWVDPWWEVGFSRVTLPTSADPGALKGKPVVAKGKVPADVTYGPREPSGTGCVIMQARSDWVVGKEGIRMVRGYPEGTVLVSTFLADSLEPFQGLEASLVVNSMKPVASLGNKPDPEEIVVTFTNTLKRPLEKVRLRMHYEGCYGKPGSEMLGHDAGTVPAGGKVTARFPVIAMGDRSGGKRPPEAHLAWSIQVTSGSTDTVVDLDVGLPTLGVKVDCPTEKGSK
jgi:hypothetical protein